MSTRHGPPSGGVPQTAMSPPRSTSAPVSAGQAARMAPSARVAAKPLPMPPRSTAAPCFEPRLAGLRVDLDSRAGVPARRSAPLRARRAARTSGRSRRRRAREESSGRTVRRSRLARRIAATQRLDEPLVDRDPGAAGAVEPREVALRVEARERPLAGRHLAPRRCERSRGRLRVGLRSALTATAQAVPIARNSSRRSSRVTTEPSPARAAAVPLRSRRRPAALGAQAPAAGGRAASAAGRRRARRPARGRCRRRSGRGCR